jgi:hypothetical protein
MRFSALGSYTPPRAKLFVPISERLEHKARHGVKPRHGIRRWARSVLREAGDFLFGAFMPFGESV